MSNRDKNLSPGLARIERRRNIINKAWRDHERKIQQRKDEVEKQEKKNLA